MAKEIVELFGALRGTAALFDAQGSYRVNQSGAPRRNQRCDVRAQYQRKDYGQHYCQIDALESSCKVSLLGPQCLHGIDSRGAARGDVSRERDRNRKYENGQGFNSPAYAGNPVEHAPE